MFVTQSFNHMKVTLQFSSSLYFPLYDKLEKYVQFCSKLNLYNTLVPTQHFALVYVVNLATQLK